MAGGEGCQVRDHGLHVIGGGEGDEAPFGAQPSGEAVYPVGEFAVGEGQSVGDDGRPVSVARKIGSERYPREIKLRGHPTMVLAKAHLSKNGG